MGRLPDSEVSRREDSALVARIIAGSGGDEPFRLLVTKYWRLLIAWVRPRVNDESEAEDVAQETFIRAFRALKGLQDHGRFVPWLLRIASNRATDLSRRRRNDQSLERLLAEGRLQPALAGEEDLGRELDQEAEYRSVVQAVRSLPEKYRLVVMLRYFEGLSGTQIAETLGEPEGTIRNRLFRAHEKIRRLIEKGLSPSAIGRRRQGT
jgi:RNA polymerase sigma-70 factor (ECF subfamily)